MSSTIHIFFDAPVSASAWAGFCAGHDVVFSPNTTGQCYYYHGGLGGVELCLGAEGSVQANGRGEPLWGTAKPPETFPSLHLSAYNAQGHATVGALAREIVAAFPGEVQAAPELQHEVVDLPTRYEAGDGYDAKVLLPTDLESAWRLEGDALVAKVHAGEARVARRDGLHVLEVDGVRRASFRAVEPALAFAGRSSWSWWRGPRPGTDEQSPPAGPGVRLEDPEADGPSM